MAVTPTEEKSDPRIEGLAFVGAMVALMWVIQIVNSIDDYKLDLKFGIIPRHVSGLDGVLFAPLLHGSWSHLIGNTVPFVVLGGIVALSGLQRVMYVTAITGVLGGFGTWLISPSNSYVIGASGVVFGYAAYLVARGVFTRNLLHLVGGVVVAAIYGFTLLDDLIPHPGVSWQGHLCGGLAGIFAARLLSTTPQEKKPDAARDPLAGMI